MKWIKSGTEILQSRRSWR